MTLTPKDLDKLEELAETSTDGPWELSRNLTTHSIISRSSKCKKHDYVLVCTVGTNSTNSESNRKYISKLDPQTVKQLIALARKGMNENT